MSHDLKKTLPDSSLQRADVSLMFFLSSRHAGHTETYVVANGVEGSLEILLAHKFTLFLTQIAPEKVSQFMVEIGDDPVFCRYVEQNGRDGGEAQRQMTEEIQSVLRGRVPQPRVSPLKH